jgi:ketosteroid isomerase-like protein
MTRSDVPDNKAVVRALLEAHNDGRVDDLLRLVDPAAVWETATRPGRDFYLGKDGALALFGDIRAAYGDHRIECQELVDLEQGQVHVKGVVVRTTGDGRAVALFSTLVTVRDGLVVRLMTEPGDLRDASAEGPERP